MSAGINSGKDSHKKDCTKSSKLAYNIKVISHWDDN